jgi:LacI family transcriptional regulator
VKIGKHDSDCIVPGKAEAARSGVRNIAKLIDRGSDAFARLLAHILKTVERARDRGDGQLRAMRGRVDGLVVMAPHLGAAELSAALPRGLPSILINTRDASGQYPAIRLDNAAGARAVVDHLASMGRRRLVHISGPAENIDAQERAEAFRKAVETHGIQGRVVEGDFEMESGETAITALLAEGVKFDAVFAANDNMAIGALDALRAAGRNVPEDVAVAGFDDIPLARHLGITTVRVRIAELGERALGRLLEDVTKGDAGGDELHAPELVVRSTTDPKASN